MSDTAEITQWLSAARGGDRRRSTACCPRSTANCTAWRGASSATRTATPSTPPALVHEAYLRLAGRADAEFEDRAHFFAYAASAMRSVVVDYARQRLAVKRGGDLHRVTDLPEDVGGGMRINEELLGLDVALDAPRRCRPEPGPGGRAALFRRPVRNRDRRPAQALRAQRAPRLAEGAPVPARLAAGLTPARRMEGERWTTLSPLLDELLELDGRERAQRLARSRPTDPGLAADLARLMALEDERPDFLSQPVVDADGFGTQPGQRDRPVQAGVAAGRRRHGPGLAGDARRRPVRAPRRDQAAAPGPGRRRPARALHPRAADPRAPGPRAHRAPARCRHQRRRPALPRARLRAAASRSPTTRRSSTLDLRDAPAAVPAGLRRGQPRARQPGRAPRPQALEHPGDLGRRGLPARFRHRQAARRSRRRAPPRSPRTGSARLHPALRRARAAARRVDHHHDRRVRARRGAVRTADRRRPYELHARRPTPPGKKRSSKANPVRPSQAALRAQGRANRLAATAGARASSPATSTTSCSRR